MNTFTLLAALSLTAAVALFVALALYVHAIASELEAIGGEEKGYGVKASYLSKIRMGVRAIETHAGLIGPQVTRLNATLGGVNEGLGAIDRNLGGVLDAVTAQEGR
ncbi:MAG: hypothetical protein ACT4OZ_03275 [Gemmatimonadota bacterium]